MRSILFIIFASIISSSAVFAADVSKQELAGTWEFVYWAESEDADSKRAINMLMDFREDGTVISHRKKGKTTASYQVNGNTIEYHDKKGSQRWHVIFFSPNESMKVNHMGAVMYFEKR